MSKFSVKKPLTVLVGVIIVIVLGIVSVMNMTPDLMPNIDMPYVVVMTTYPGASPEKVETTVTKPLEQTLATLENIKHVQSTSSENISMIALEFNDDVNMDTISVDILQKVNLIEGYWDDMVGTPYILKINPNMIPVMVASVAVDDMSVDELSAFVNDELLKQLEGVSGVASITASGMLEQNVCIELSSEKLAALEEKIFGVIDLQFADADAQLAQSQAQLDEAAAAIQAQINSINENAQLSESAKAAYIEQINSSEQAQQLKTAQEQLDSAKAEIDAAKKQAHLVVNLSSVINADMISQILTAQNFSMPAGYADKDGAAWIVNVGDSFSGVDELSNLTLFDIGMEGIEPVKLTDVADVYIGDNSDSIYAKINGNNGVLLSFSKQSSKATAEVSDNINAKFKELEKKYSGLHFEALMDQGDYIYMITDAVVENLLLGALFAVIILFFFLKDIKPTFIILCSIPISVLFAIALMYFSGVTLNMISLSGLAVAVGMLVDNSVVVIENIFRLRDKGVSTVKAAVSGAAQVAGAIVSSTLTTVCVFLPIVFVEGITRQLFTDMALTMGYALIASLIIALTLVPAMSASMLKKINTGKHHRIMDAMLRGYERAIRWTLSHKAIAFLFAIVMLAGSVVLTLQRGFIFMPDMGMPQLSAEITMPDGASFEETCEMADYVSAEILKIEDVDTVGAMMGSDMTGGMLTGGSSGASTGKVTLYIMLDEKAAKKSGEISEQINEMFTDLDCTVDASGSALTAVFQTMLGGSGVSVNVYSDDLDKLSETATLIAEKLSGVEGITEVSNGITETDPSLKITVDKNKAALNGLTSAQIYMAISDALSTETNVSTIATEFGELDMTVISREGVPDIDALKDYTLSVTGTDGNTKNVKLSDVASVEESETMSSISRTDQRRYLAVTAILEDGYNVSLVTEKAQKILKDLELPEGVSYEFAGENETIVSALKDLLIMLVLGVLLVYLIMVAQFQSLKSPFIVMFTIPLAFTGGLLGLLITGQVLSVVAMIGMVMLTGIIVNNGIVLVDYINKLRSEGVDKIEAIVEAGKTRMRPILMTTVTTILGLVVMALGRGTGSEVMQPIAIVCIGGLVYATILTLFIVPAMYSIMNKKKMREVEQADLEITDE